MASVEIDVVELYVAAAATFGRAVVDVGDNEWDLATPCSDWNVREVVAHVVLGEAHFRAVLAGETAVTQSSLGVDLLGTSPEATWRGTALAAIEAAKQPGVAERVYDLDLGPVSGAQLLSYRITDNVVHAWDVAVGVRRPQPIQDRLAEFLLEFWQPVAADMARSESFAAPVAPVGERPGQRLLALLGRTPPPTDN